MDSTTHTIVAVCLLAVVYYIGRWRGFKKGHQDGIADGIGYLIEFGACSEEDIRRANEKFDQQDIED